MSLQTSYSTKSKRLYRAVLLALVGTSSGGAYAVSFGETAVQSAQSEPLSATIVVNDINSKDFKVSLANGTIYKQMGLTPNASIKVTFQPTSKHSGKIVLKSTAPINDPFADIVLDINNNNKKQFMPKTLLMPINENKRINVQPSAKPKTIVAGNATPNLPKVTPVQPPAVTTPKVTASKVANSTITSATTTSPATTTNTVAKTAKSVNVPASQIPGIPDGEFAAATRQAFLLDQSRAQAKANDKANVTASNTKATDKKVNVAKPVAKPVMDTKAKNSKDANVTSKNLVASSKSKVPAVVSKEPPIGTLSGDRLLLKDSKLQAKSNKDAKQHSKSSTHAKSATQSRGKGTYVVQRNDNLWTIASEIAERNKISVHKVMKQIQQQNPKAFSHGKASLLIANKTLILPDYEVIPSQSSLEKAIEARRARIAKGKTRKVVAKSKKAKSHKKSHTRKSTLAKGNRHKKKTHYQAKANQHKAKAHVSLVTPNSTKKPSAMKKSAGVASSKSPLVKKLKNSRQTMAQKATHVKKLNSQVNSYTKKLHLQNKKLAELEARLKKLKGQ